MKMTSPRLFTLLGIGALVGAVAPAHAAPPTPFTLDLDGTPTQWHTHSEERPQPPLAENPRCATTPPPNSKAVDILFDGKNFDKWDAMQNRKKVSLPWTIKDGVMTATNNDIRTKKSYGSAQLHIEWRVPKDRPSFKGQSSTNSGVMFGDGRYEIQVLDVHPATNKTYPDGMAGAIYSQFPPKSNAALPKGEWQSFDITYTAPRFDEKGIIAKRARFHVVFNGIVVQDDQELVGDCSYRGSKLFPTVELKETAKLRHGHGLLQPHPLRLPLRLQFHGDPIEFRNIWIVDLEGKN